MASTPLAATTAKIAGSLGISESELFRQALASFIQEKKRQVLQQWLHISARYSAGSVADLESKITQGQMAEHPAWEDLIVPEIRGGYLAGNVQTDLTVLTDGDIIFVHSRPKNRQKRQP